MTIRRRNHSANVLRHRTARNFRLRTRIRVSARRPFGAGATTDLVMERKKRIRHQPADELRPGAHRGHLPDLDSDDDIVAALQGIRMPREDPEAMERASELPRSAQLSRADGGKGGRRQRGAAGDGPAGGPGAGPREASSASRMRKARVAREQPPRTAPVSWAWGHIGQSLVRAPDGHRQRRSVHARTSRRNRCRGGGARPKARGQDPRDAVDRSSRLVRRGERLSPAGGREPSGDAMRAGIEKAAKESKKTGLSGWRKSETNPVAAKDAFHLVRMIGRARRGREAYLAACKPFIERMENAAVALSRLDVRPRKIRRLAHSSIARAS